MSNMSYCRFQNTHADMKDCLEALNNRENLSKDEKDAATRMLKSVGEFLLDNKMLTDNEGDMEVSKDNIKKYLDTCTEE